MKLKAIYYSSHFERAFRKLSRPLQKLALEKEKIFRNDLHDHRLKTHRLQGTLSERWSFSVTYSYRILFQFLKSDEVVFVDIGTHEIYQ